MPHSDPARQRRDNLLEQDTGLNEETLRNERMTLAKTLETLEDRAWKIQRASYVGLAVVIVCILAILPMEAFHWRQILWVAVVWGVIGYGAFLTTLVLLIIDWFRYRPAIERKRSKLQTGLLLELQQQVAEIRAELDRRNGEDRGA